MNSLRQIIKQFIEWIKGQPSPPEDVFVQKLMELLLQENAHEMGCEEVFEVMDLYAEAVARGENVQEVMPLVQHHIEKCGVCREEFEMLMDMIHYEQNLST